MSDRVQIIKGFQDIVPPRSRAFAAFEDEARRVFALYGYEEVRLPVLEKTELFARGIGPGTDIVDKEMFTFSDRKGRSLSLRPEGTACLVRAYLDSGKGKGEPVKWFYRGPMFRYERPQKGRYRQFNQIGAEAIGYAGPGADAELIAMLDRLWQPNPATSWSGLTSPARLEINSLGCRQCRPAYREALVKYLDDRRAELCPDCLERLNRNPLRALDCKVPACQAAVSGAPSTLDFLDADCQAHFDGVKADLDALGVGYTINPRIVRGLDYYTRTVFEYLADTGGSQNAIAAGGRYDGLVEEFGGPETPGIGFAIGVERVMLLLPDPPDPRPEYFIVVMGEAARAAGLKLLASLRSRGVRAEMVLDGLRGLKAQMKAADKARALRVVVIGDEELNTGLLTVKDLSNGEQAKKKAEEL